MSREEGLAFKPIDTALKGARRPMFRESAVRKHSTAKLLLCILCSCLVQLANAKQEFRQQDWTWRLYGGVAADFDTPEAVVEAWNARDGKRFDQCAQQTCKSCGKTTYLPPTRINSMTSFVSGKPTTLGTDQGTYTFFNTACTIGGVFYPATPIQSQPAGAGIAATSVRRCPDGWNVAVSKPTYTLINGSSYTTYDSWCQLEIPDPPLACSNHQESAADGAGSIANGAVFGNPIDAIDMAKIERALDYQSADGQLSVARFYSSKTGRWAWNVNASLIDTAANPTSNAASTILAAVTLYPPNPNDFVAGPMMAAVRVPRAFPLIRTMPAAGQHEVSVVGPRGERAIFTQNADQSFSTLSPLLPQLSTVSGAGAVQWRLRDPAYGFHHFDASGMLIERVNVDGRWVSYARTANALTVTAMPSGRTLTFTKGTGSGQYESVTLPDGNSLAFGNDPYSRIATVGYPDGSTKSYLYGESANIGTTTAHPEWLTGTIDENGSRFATFKYNGQYPISTELAGGVGLYLFFYVDSTTSGSTRVTFPPPGGPATIGWDTAPDGERRVVSRSQPAGSGCAGASSSLGYDTVGNVTRRDDFKGNRSCYKYDLTRNLESARVEGLSSATACPADVAAYAIPINLTADKPQIKVSTSWHPDWRLETKRAEPKKLTTWVYNGQPDPSAGNATASCAPADALLPDGKPIAVLCKKIEQATTDASGTLGFAATTTGNLRTWTWTYNRYGQVLSEDGPRTDVADTTSYTYYADTSFDASGAGHTTGDLWKITNAKGQVTAFTLYDKHGHALEIVDPNGLVTRMGYHVRGWLTSRSTGPASGVRELTQYDYDAAGQLKKVTQPDGSFLAYTYDAAHRLTDLTDSLGNRIHYTLDAMGNRTREEVKDPAGSLVRSQRRVYDALNRVQNLITPAQ